MRSDGLVRVFVDGAVLDRSGVERSLLHSGGIVHEELDPHGRETGGGGTARAVRGRVVGEKELRAVNRQSGDDVPSIQVPEDDRAECAL